MSKTASVEITYTGKNYDEVLAVVSEQLGMNIPSARAFLNNNLNQSSPPPVDIKIGSNSMQISAVQSQPNKTS